MSVIEDLVCPLPISIDIYVNGKKRWKNILIDQLYYLCWRNDTMVLGSLHSLDH